MNSYAGDEMGFEKKAIRSGVSPDRISRRSSAAQKLRAAAANKSEDHPCHGQTERTDRENAAQIFSNWFLMDFGIRG
jgi:hypothetical protein